jgi:hypothetical protein
VGESRLDSSSTSWGPCNQVNRSSVAFHLPEEAGISIIDEQSHPLRFEIGQRRCSTNIDTVAVPNQALREVWAGSRMVGGKRIACEEGQGEGEEGGGGPDRQHCNSPAHQRLL